MGRLAFASYARSAMVVLTTKEGPGLRVVHVLE
jgi:hypothetical protein